MISIGMLIGSMMPRPTNTIAIRDQSNLKIFKILFINYILRKKLINVNINQFI
jgi:hypothetical protein